jgi:hypothetical protein
MLHHYVGIDIGLRSCALAHIIGWAESAQDSLPLSLPLAGPEALDRALRHFGTPQEVFVGLEDGGEPTKTFQKYLTERGWNCRVFNPIRYRQIPQEGEIPIALRIAKTLRYSWTEGTGGEGLIHTS